MHIVLIFLGCGIGGIARYLTSNLAYQILGRTFPIGTLVVNVIGSLVMGILFILLLERIGNISQYLRSLLLIGFLGGFTTFSSFSIETINLFESGKHILAFVNIFASLILCILASGIGIIIGRQL